MKKPIIGILANLLITEGGFFPGLDRTYVNHDYVRAVATAGGLPVLLPVITDKQDIQQQIEGIDGLLLTGGQDISPIFRMTSELVAIRYLLEGETATQCLVFISEDPECTRYIREFHVRQD